MFKRILRRRPASLADCPACGADFVHPVEWSPEDAHTWWMLLRCGACDVRRKAIVSNLDAARFDRDLDIAEAHMRHEADLLSRERQDEEADRFARALELDLIDPADFGDS